MMALSDFIAGLLIVFGATIYSVKYSFMIYFHVFLSWNDKPKLFFRSRIKSLHLLKVLPFFSSCVQSLHKLVYTGLYAEFGL